MSFDILRDRLPALRSSDHPMPPWPQVGRGGVSFSDDLARPDGGRVAVRVRVTDRDQGGYRLDFRDSDPMTDDGHFRLTPDQVHQACLIALGHALDSSPQQSWSNVIECLTSAQTWVGTAHARVDPATTAFGMARVADALLGALANAWPDRVGAGSCSLGAIVQLRQATRVVLTEVLPGGEGARAQRRGNDAWPGLIIPAVWPPLPHHEEIELESSLRENSGGVGHHPGGSGVVRSYRAPHPLVGCIAFDRVSNPPHGLDRAGPPLGTEVWLYQPDHEQPLAIEPWRSFEIPAHARLEVRTCGGAGWGFPGYGAISWDPNAWSSTT